MFLNRINTNIFSIVNMRAMRIIYSSVARKGGAASEEMTRYEQELETYGRCGRMLSTLRVRGSMGKHDIHRSMLAQRYLE